MKIEIIKSSTSERDFAELVEYLAAIDEDLARRFMKAVDDTAEGISEFPDMGNPWESDVPRLKNWRFCNVLGFENYLIFYRRVQFGVQLMRLLDGRRDLPAIL